MTKWKRISHEVSASAHLARQHREAGKTAYPVVARQVDEDKCSGTTSATIPDIYTSSSPPSPRSGRVQGILCVCGGVEWLREGGRGDPGRLRLGKQTVAWPGPFPQCCFEPEQLHEAAYPDLAPQEQAP